MPNKVLLKKIWLKKDEMPILIIRSSYLKWLWPLVLSSVLLVAGFFSMAYLWHFGLIGIAVFALVLFLAVFIFCQSLYEHYYTCWVLTNLRLIDLYQRGFFRRETSEIIFNKIKEVYANKSGLISGLFNLGDINVSLIGSNSRLLIKGVPGYERAVSEIILQQENYQRLLFSCYN